MPTNITEVEAFTAPVVVPTGGDPRTAASVLAGFQPLADRTLWLGTKIKWVYAAPGTGAVTSGYQTITAITFTTVTGASVALTPAVGDFMFVWAQGTFSSTGLETTGASQSGHVRIASSSASKAIGVMGAGNAYIRPFTDGAANRPHYLHLFGYEVAAYAETYTLALQASKRSGAVGDVDVYQNAQIFAAVIRPNP